MTRLLLERGAKVIIWDINQLKIEETISEFSEIGDITGFYVDVSNREQIKETAKKNGRIDLLINNAGIVVGKYFHEHTTEDITKTVAINSNAPLFVTMAFLEGMLTRNSGHICNIASSAGIISNPKMSVYAASKWFITGWSDSLRIEMKQMKKDITVTTVMPYYINTGMFDGVKSKIPILDPESAALKIIKAIEKGKKMISIPGYIYRLTRLSQAILSINMLDRVMNMLGIYKTMNYFVGHKKS